MEAGLHQTATLFKGDLNPNHDHGPALALNPMSKSKSNHDMNPDFKARLITQEAVRRRHSEYFAMWHCESKTRSLTNLTKLNTDPNSKFTLTQTTILDLTLTQILTTLSVSFMCICCQEPNDIGY